MIRTWIADVTSLLEKEKYLQYYKIVPDFRKEKADKIVYQEGKALSVGVWVLYEKMRRTYGLSKNAVFNLSHSGQYVLCSVVDSERQIWHLGCRYRRCQAGETGVARRFFCASEFQRIVEQNHGSGKSGGVLSLLGVERKFYESDPAWDEIRIGSV